MAVKGLKTASVTICFIKSCVCLQEEILDESQNLNDVRPFWPVLKLVEKKGDRTSKTLDRRVNILIGKGQYISVKNYY